MITISLCMIVKNEEDVLGRCLTSIKDLVDEIIIVDTGSTDKTKEIAKNFTRKVYDFKWIDDFSAARNYSFSKATQDYIMWLDADDVIEAQELEKLKALKKTLKKETDVVMIKYDVSFDAEGNPTMSFFRERIVKNDKSFIWKDPVHETIETHGNIIHHEAHIAHKKESLAPSGRNLIIYENYIKNGNLLTPRQKFYYSRELYFNNKLGDAIKSFIEFLDENKGWRENNIEACLNLSKCYALKKENTKALKSLYSSFAYDSPRAEILCEIGKILMEEKKYDLAIKNFHQALKCKNNPESGSFVLNDCYKFIPYLELCVCYYKINDIKKSIYYNNKAHKLKPYDSAVQFNKTFFKNLTNK